MRWRVKSLTPARVRRGVLAAVLLAVIVFPLPNAVSSQLAPLACRGCHTIQPVTAERWAVRLPGQWAASGGAAGTVPVSGQAYVAVGGGLAAVGDGLTVTAYRLANGAALWRVPLAEPAGSAIMSVRAWHGVVTAGVASPAGSRTKRTEVIIDSDTGRVLASYPAAEFGGAVAASPQSTVIVGPDSVTSYDNDTGRLRWRRATGAGQAWRTDNGTLYVTRAAGGFLGAGPVTGLQVIDLKSGAERTMASPGGHPFSGILAGAMDGTVLFSSASGVTAYSGSTGGELWSVAGSVPEGTDPATRLVYLTSAGGALIGVSPASGKVLTTVPGSATTGAAGMYVVRGGVALGLDSGPGGEAWGYSVAAGRATWTVAGLPWPHYFSDLSGVGGSAAAGGTTVVIAACPHLAAGTTASSPSATTSPPATSPPGTSSPPAAPGPASSPAPVRLCADPELVALNV
jgi:hypothetical protein